MLYGLESGLQRRFQRHGADEMFQELKLIFQANARVERYEVSNKFYSCKMEENSSVSEHILRISGYHKHLKVQLSWVVLVIPNNIYLIELMLFQDKYFRKAQCLSWHG